MPTSGWPSTATPTAASWSTSAASWSARRTLTALIASRELAREPGSTVIHNLITSRAVPEIVTELGGIPVRTRVGHSFIKATMAETDAVFGGEHSGHFYFRDFWRADSGMLAALHVLAALAEHGPPAVASCWPSSPATSAPARSTRPSTDQAAVVAGIEQEYGGRDGVTLDHLDGLTVQPPRTGGSMSGRPTPSRCCG